MILTPTQAAALVEAARDLLKGKPGLSPRAKALDALRAAIASIDTKPSKD